MNTMTESPKNTHRYKKASLIMSDDYVKYVQECNAKVKLTGNTSFKAEPEFVWQIKKQ
jgi:hypothetical protein